MPGRVRRWLQRRGGVAEPARADLVDLASGSIAEDEQALLRRIAAEAVILQDQAEESLRRARARAPLGQVAPQAGPLVHRFFQLRDRLPERCLDPGNERLRATLDVILHHHGVLVATALDLLAYDYRSERVASAVETIEIGAVGRQLDEVYAELTAAR